LLSRGFVKYALENPVGSLETEIRYLYTDEDGLKLAKHVVEDGNDVISNSEVGGPDGGEWEMGRVTRLSQGGLQVLKRTINALDQILRNTMGASSGHDMPDL